MNEPLDYWADEAAASRQMREREARERAHMLADITVSPDFARGWGRGFSVGFAAGAATWLATVALLWAVL